MNPFLTDRKTLINSIKLSNKAFKFGVDLETIINLFAKQLRYNILLIFENIIQHTRIIAIRV